MAAQGTLTHVLEVAVALREAADVHAESLAQTAAAAAGTAERATDQQPPVSP